MSTSMNVGNLSIASVLVNVTTPSRSSQGDRNPAVTPGLPLLLATKHPSPLPIPLSHKHFLYWFSIAFWGVKLRHPVRHSHNFFGVPFSRTVNVRTHA